MTYILEKISLFLANIEWSNFVLDMIATLVGFALALWGEKLVANSQTRQTKKELKRLFIEELTNVAEKLEKWNSSELDIHPLDIPSWEAAINAGQISLLDQITKQRLFIVYNNIREFNSWSHIHTNYYFEKEKKNTLLNNQLNELQQALLKDETSEGSISWAISTIKERK